MDDDTQMTGQKKPAGEGRLVLSFRGEKKTLNIERQGGIFILRNKDVWIIHLPCKKPNILFSKNLLGIEPIGRDRRSAYTAAKYLPVPRAGNGNSLITGNTLSNARQNC